MEIAETGIAGHRTSPRIPPAIRGPLFFFGDAWMRFATWLTTVLPA